MSRTQSRRRDYPGQPLKVSIPSLQLGKSSPDFCARLYPQRSIVEKVDDKGKLTARPFIPKSKISSVADVGLHFSINGQIKQQGTAKDMIFGVPKLISFVSSIMRLEVGPSLLLVSSCSLGIGTRCPPYIPPSLRIGTTLNCTRKET
jgi:hypothetical protein